MVACGDITQTRNVSEYMLVLVLCLVRTAVTVGVELRVNEVGAVQIFFTELKYTFVETQVAFSMQSLMCDIGGSLGLILGATMLTVCEIVDFLFQLFVHWIKVRAASAVVVVEP